MPDTSSLIQPPDRILSKQQPATMARYASSLPSLLPDGHGQDVGPSHWPPRRASAGEQLRPRTQTSPTSVADAFLPISRPTDTKRAAVPYSAQRMSAAKPAGEFVCPACLLPSSANLNCHSPSDPRLRCPQTRRPRACAATGRRGCRSGSPHVHPPSCTQRCAVERTCTPAIGQSAQHAHCLRRSLRNAKALRERALGELEASVPRSTCARGRRRLAAAGWAGRR